MKFLRANTSRTIKITVPGPFTMSQQAQNDFYKDEEEMALDYAAAVNAEIKDLFAAGADIVQIDEPYMQARPEKARKYGLKALNAALDGVKGTTAVHICFGYAAIIHVRPEGYSFLPEFANSPVQQVSIETAQSGLDCAVLEKLPGKTIILGVLDLSDMTVETPETVADAHPPRAAACAGRAHRRRAGLRAEISAARRGVRKDVRDGRGREDRQKGIGGSVLSATAGRRSQARCRTVRIAPIGRPGRHVGGARDDMKSTACLDTGDDATRNHPPRVRRFT